MEPDVAAASVGVGLLALFVLALVVFGPFILVWCLNTLFPVLVIPYTFKTWLASLLLPGVLGLGIRTITTS